MPRPTISPTNFLSHHLRENPYITKLPFDLHLTGDSCEGEGEHYSWFHQDKDRKAGLVQTGSNCLPRYVTPLPTYSGQKMMIPPPMVNYHLLLILHLCHPDHFPQKSYIFPLPNLCLECPSCLCMTTAFSRSKTVAVGPTASSLPKQPLALCTSRPQPRLPPGQDLLYTASR